ncbi:MAG: YicC family protein [Synergistaceae bacterium]|nr:YicC family protein [Synergistaceae bacterium]
MFLSMTGFGSNSHEFSWGKVSFEITSVNHKFQEFSARLPRELSSLENRIISLMRNSIGRGKVRITAEIAWNSGARIPVLDEEGLMNMFNQVRRISKKNNLDCPPDLTRFLVVPDIFDTENNAAEQAAHEEPEIWDEIISAAIASLMEMKKSEGEKLHAKVDEDLSALVKILDTLKKRWEVANSEALESLRTRIQNVMEHYNLEIDENRIAQEVALMSDKWDVSEEITRLDAHVEKFKQVMNAENSSGKKLDFLIQEMNREVNTMGSKVADASFRWGVVEAKTCIERIREQLQNIE